MLSEQNQTRPQGEKLPFTDERGNFYCRSIHGVLETKQDQYVCGIGCPYYDATQNQQIQCQFMTQWQQEHEERDANEIQKYMQQEIDEDRQSLFPVVDNMDLKLLIAYQYAAKAHRGQFRKGTKIPYFAHLITTMNYAMQLTNDIDVLVAAVLHDTVEDTPVTLEDIKVLFGTKIASYIEQETENKRSALPAEETWEIRKQENIKHLQQAEHEVKIIVLSDKAANAESMVREWRCHGDAIWDKFNQKDKKKQAWYYRSCKTALQEFAGTGVMNCYESYLEELFGKEV